MQSLQLHIGGMACSFCTQSINQALTQREGVEKVSVSLATTGLLYPVWAMVAMVASVTAVLANSFWGRLLSKASQHREEKRQQQSITYQVPNMHCKHCVETIKQMLTNRFEDITVETDLDQHLVTIVYVNGNVNDSSLREALVEIGYKPEKHTRFTSIRCACV